MTVGHNGATKVMRAHSWLAGHEAYECDVRTLAQAGAAHLPPRKTPARTVALIAEHFLSGVGKTSGR
ncbi:hypothetical protein [Streptomyces chiangmaiensis]|uniref:Uncharacterized protein n=1 Tax=Streptomyces chiangmaiensis TaxID=766497 RepID=A0ABU7FKK2_9ACTN|nr:hypothetical protein [Streptomyces chiangmaiensis]MED7824646.1 hypothetical protein [Streptomyces chiangmaiensis]